MQQDYFLLLKREQNYPFAAILKPVSKTNIYSRVKKKGDEKEEKKKRLSIEGKGETRMIKKEKEREDLNTHIYI